MTEINQSLPVVIRSKVDHVKNYSEYREILRFDFWFSCGYCEITEFESWGIGFEIDHYCPKKSHFNLINDYNNLIWSCEKCNRYKHDYYPDEEDKLKGNIVLRPDKDNPWDHLELEGYLLKGKTHTGNFNIHLLELNRLQLRKLRQIREKLWNAKKFIAFGIHKIASYKIDRMKQRRRRYPFLILRKKFLEREAQINESLDSVLRQFAKSPFLDEDPEKRERQKRRRKYLREQKAIKPSL